MGNFTFGHTSMSAGFSLSVWIFRVVVCISFGFQQKYKKITEIQNCYTQLFGDYFKNTKKTASTRQAKAAR